MGMETKLTSIDMPKIKKKSEKLETQKLPEKLEKNNETNKLPEKIEKKQMEPLVEIVFKLGEGLDYKEFVRQLKGQERGLNSMDIAEWMENRQNYLENGRSPEGAEAQAVMRDKAYHSRIESNQKKGMSYKEAVAEAKTWIKTQAALHNPDQIAGGDPSKVSRMGDKGVNSSIGSQWRSKVEILEKGIEAYAKGKSQEELANTKLNIKLRVER